MNKSLRRVSGIGGRRRVGDRQSSLVDSLHFSADTLEQVAVTDSPEAQLHAIEVPANDLGVWVDSRKVSTSRLRVLDKIGDGHSDHPSPKATGEHKLSRQCRVNVDNLGAVAAVVSYRDDLGIWKGAA